MKKVLLAFGFLLALMGFVNAEDSRFVTVYNHTGHTFQYILGSHVGQAKYDWDFLGQRILGPHSNIVINVDDGGGWCKFDLKAQSESGWESAIWNVNVCVTHEWHIWDES